MAACEFVAREEKMVATLSDDKPITDSKTTSHTPIQCTNRYRVIEPQICISERQKLFRTNSHLTDTPTLILYNFGLGQRVPGDSSQRRS
jgi:hypothetical protein